MPHSAPKGRFSGEGAGTIIRPSQKGGEYPLNRGLKELCKLAEINDSVRITTYKGNVRHDDVYFKWELVGTHIGRRTFIVQALSMGIYPNVVMKWTGHSDYKAMKPYIDIVDSIKAESMTKFNNLL